MAVQFSLSYDANGDPVLVENTVSGTRKVISRSSVVSPYKSRFETPATGDPVTDAEESQPESNQNAIMDYIMEMEKGADADPNLSFVQKQKLEGYTPEAIEARSKEPTNAQKAIKAALSVLTPLGAVETFVKTLAAILPEESQPESNQSAIMDYIMEMEKGADADPNLSFVQKQNLERYTPEAIEARSKKKTRSQEIVETVIKAVLPYANAAGAAVKTLEAILPEESPEIKAIKQFYADPEQQALVESIPGMSDYNLVYGNPFDPSYGLADAADKRTDRIAKTLRDKYGMTSAEIEMAKLGTYTGPVDSDLIGRIKKTTDLSKKEREERNRINRRTTAPVGAQFKETGYADPGADAEENQPYRPPPSNIPTGIREDTPGGGEFSSPGGGRDIGSRAGASYESVQDDDYGLL